MHDHYNTVELTGHPQRFTCGLCRLELGGLDLSVFSLGQIIVIVRLAQPRNRRRVEHAICVGKDQHQFVGRVVLAKQELATTYG